MELDDGGGSGPGNPIENDPNIARIFIAFNKATGQMELSWPPDEMLCRAMMDKAKTYLDDLWRKANTPLVQAPANGLDIRASLNPFKRRS